MEKDVIEWGTRDWYLMLYRTPPRNRRPETHTHTQSRWILKQRHNADFEVYAKRFQHSAHSIKYLEAFMPNDGHKAQSNKVQTILAI